MEYMDVKNTEIGDLLKAVGKAIFIDFYYDFKDTSITTRKLAEKIFKNSPRAKSDNQNFRIARARRIFEEEQEVAALENIINSLRVDANTRNRAQIILESEKAARISASEFEEEQQFISELNRRIPYIGDKKIEYENTPKPPKIGENIVLHKYPRSRAVSERALLKANYLCECGVEHVSFKRKNCHKNYTEPHHLIPLSAAADFPKIDLDREQNVVSLCSNCHNWLHYGDGIDVILQPLYEKRKDLLKAIGAEITYDQLKSYYK